MNAITCTGLRKTYPAKPPVDAVQGIDLTVDTGECFGLLGPNGAGKTTTMEILEGLLDATSGDVEVFGLRWGTDDRELKQRIGISLQETKLTDKLTVLETIRLFRSFYRTGIEPAEAVARVQLEEKQHTYNDKLSGGQRQRLAVACALIGDPELLFLDEPTTGLDPQSRRQLWDVISRFRQTGRTVLLTTHYMDEAERLCDRVAVIDKGKIIALGTPRELILQSGGEQVIEFQVSQGETQPDIEKLEQLTGVVSVWTEEDRVVLSVGEPHVTLPVLLNHLQELGVSLAGLTVRSATLEDVFLNLTGRHLRDSED